MNFLKACAAIFLVTLVTGCSTVPETNPSLSHPLINTIYSSRDDQTLSKQSFLARIKQADIIYLGEHHNNLDHHRKQLAVIKELVAAGLKPAIGLETFAIEQTSILMNYSQLKNSPHLSHSTFNSEDWLKNKLLLNHKKNQSTWEYYGAIIKYAFDNNLPLFGMDLNKSLRHQITKKGIEKLSAVEKQLLHPTGFENDNYRLLMHENFKKGHCGWGKPAYLDRLYDNWKARNETMATAITSMALSHKEGPIVAILGAAHTQFNMGVHERVRHLQPHLKQANLTFLGVRDNIRSVTPYGLRHVFRGVEYGYEYQYYWFTQGLPTSGTDMCSEYLKLKKSKK